MHGCYPRSCHGQQVYSSLLVCLFVHFKSTHLYVICAAFTAFTQQVKVADFDVETSLSNKSEQKLTCMLAAWPLASVNFFQGTYLHAAEVILYQKQWKGVYRISFLMLLAILSQLLYILLLYLLV